MPRGQASYTTHKDIHYNYKQAGGSPPDEVMCERLLDFTNKVNRQGIGNNYNTILLNVYKDGKDHIAPHSDSTAGLENTGFATVFFGYDWRPAA
jgi:hypothetical protein